MEHDNFAFKQDIEFNLGTAFSLRMEGLDDMNQAIKRFESLLDVEMSDVYK